MIDIAPLTTTEAAAALDVNRVTILRWIEAGHIAPLRQLAGKGGYLFAAAEVERVRQAPRPARPRKHRPCQCGCLPAVAAAAVA